MSHPPSHNKAPSQFEFKMKIPKVYFYSDDRLEKKNETEV